MKKYLSILIILLMANTVFGATYASFLRSEGVDGTTIRLNSQKQIELAQMGVQFYSGKTYYVDDNTGDAASNGETWGTAMATLDQAINRAAARVANGTDLGKPVIYVREGHEETLAGADAVDADIAGLTIIGLGNGSLKPTFTLTAAAAEFVIGADNVSISNLKFSITSSAVLAAIDIQAGIDYAVISNCEFVTSTTTGAPINFILFADNNTGCVITNNTFDAQQTLLSESAIMMDADTNQTVISNNLIQGDYLVACIEGDTTLSTEILIKGNLLVNGSSDSIIAQPAIDLLTGTTGYICDNYLVCNVATVSVAMETADTVILFNNWYNEDAGVTATGSPWHIGSQNALTVVDSVSASGDD